MSKLGIELTKGEREDATIVTRADGSTARFTFPKKGPIPHDCVHLIVEEALGFSRGFWGMIADGAAPEEVQRIAKAGGHASATRAQTPDPSIVQLIQAERLVECFEADFWGAPADLDTFRSVAAAGCAASFVPAPPLTDEAITAIRERIAQFATDWIAAPVGATFHFIFGA